MWRMHVCREVTSHLSFLFRPLHLAIIHENISLTQYLVKLIVGVYMNLDIANNMRQVRLTRTHTLVSHSTL